MAVQVNRDDFQAVSNDWCRRGRAQGKEVECEAEDPTRNFGLSHSSVFELDKPYEGTGDHAMFIIKGSIFGSHEASRSRPWNEHPVDGVHCVGELVAAEIGIVWENLSIALARILECA